MMRQKLVVALAGVWLAGCQALAVAAATQFEISVPDSTVTIARGGTGAVTVNIDHLIPEDAQPLPVIITPGGVPEGVTMDPVDLGSGLLEGVNVEDLEIGGVQPVEMPIAVGNNAPVGSHSITLNATNGATVKTATFTLVITE